MIRQKVGKKARKALAAVASAVMLTVFAAGHLPSGKAFAAEADQKTYTLSAKLTRSSTMLQQQ